MPKTVYKRRIDERPALDIGGTAAAATVSAAPPAPPLLPAPVITSITTAIYQSAQTPAAKVDLTWTYETTVAVTGYLVQWSTDSTFATDTNGALANAIDKSASIFPLPAATLYYFRVAAIAGGQGVQSPWSVAASITTAADTTPAGVPTSVAASFYGVGDLVVSWTNPTEANFRDIEVTIYASDGGAAYRREFISGRNYRYPAALNVSDSGGVGDPSLYVTLRSRTWGGILGTIVAASPVKALPAQPTVTHSWTGDTGTAGPDLTFTWAQVADALYYDISLNGQTARRADVTTYTYPLARNQADNGTPDPTITYSITAVDGLRQASTAATGTATNAAPAAPTATLTQGAVSGLYATVTSTPPADFLEYEYVFKRDGTTVATVLSAGATVRYEMQGAGDDGFHSWTVVIRQKDVFGQFSPTVTPAAVAFEALTLSYLRAQVEYSDSESTAPATLKAALADDVRDSGGITYSA